MQAFARQSPDDEVHYYSQRLLFMDSRLNQKGRNIGRRVRRMADAASNGDLETLRRLALAAECKDDETGAHMVRTGVLSALLVEKLGTDRELADNMLHAAPMHDLGKIGIPDSILLKKGPLTQVEFELMKSHTLIGAKILDGSEAPVLRLAHTIALSHHERWDGEGYPYGLSSADIPLPGRIVALIDAFDAMTSDRPYRNALSVQRTCEVIREESGKQFDPNMVSVFLSHLDVFLAMRARMNRDLPACAHCPGWTLDVRAENSGVNRSGNASADGRTKIK